MALPPHKQQSERTAALEPLLDLLAEEMVEQFLHHEQATSGTLVREVMTIAPGVSLEEAQHNQEARQ